MKKEKINFKLVRIKFRSKQRIKKHLIKKQKLQNKIALQKLEHKHKSLEIMTNHKISKTFKEIEQKHKGIKYLLIGSQKNKEKKYEEREKKLLKRINIWQNLKNIKSKLYLKHQEEGLKEIEQKVKTQSEKKEKISKTISHKSSRLKRKFTLFHKIQAKHLTTKLNKKDIALKKKIEQNQKLNESKKILAHKKKIERAKELRLKKLFAQKKKADRVRETTLKKLLKVQSKNSL